MNRQEHREEGDRRGQGLQNKEIDTSQPAVPETVGVALTELVGEVREGLLALAVGAGLVVGGEESPSVVLRLPPWRARSVARVLEEWSAVSRVFHRAPRPILTELELSRTLDLAASVLGDPEPTMPFRRGSLTVPSRQRLDAVAVLVERESRLSALQRLALVDAAASWLSEPNGGDQLAYALLGAACTAEVTTEQVYLALITPSENPGDHYEGLPSYGQSCRVITGGDRPLRGSAVQKTGPDATRQLLSTCEGWA